MLHVNSSSRHAAREQVANAVHDMFSDPLRFDYILCNVSECRGSKKAGKVTSVAFLENNQFKVVDGLREIREFLVLDNQTVDISCFKTCPPRSREEMLCHTPEKRESELTRRKVKFTTGAS